MIEKIEAVRVNSSYAYNVTSNEESDMNSILYSYFGSSISPSQFDALLNQYGITITGNVDTDAKNLYNAMYSASSTMLNSNIQSSSKASEAQKLPWADIMEQVGVVTTGDLSTDRTSFYERIGAMQSSNQDNNAQMANINLLLAEAGVVFVSITAPEQKTASAADIKAMVNKQFLLGGRMTSF